MPWRTGSELRGTFDHTGNTECGRDQLVWQPFFLDGFNENITWSATWNQPNISDVYEEKINPKNRLEYLYEEMATYSRDTRNFIIKGPNGLETVTRPLY